MFEDAVFGVELAVIGIEIVIFFLLVEHLKRISHLEDVLEKHHLKVQEAIEKLESHSAMMELNIQTILSDLADGESGEGGSQR